MTTTDLDALRGTNYEIAEAIAPTWERRRAEIERVCRPVREWLVRELDPRAGGAVLELAAGAGDTGFEALVQLGASGRLYTTDFSPAMLQVARRRAAELGIEGVEFRVVDAERIDLDDESVDGVLCRFGYMLMADPAAALAETRRVLRAGGRLALAVWGPPDQNPFFTTVALSLVQRGHIPPPEPPPAPGIFSMGSEERTTELLRGAGFADVRAEQVRVAFEVGDVDGYLAFVSDTAGPIALALRGLSDAERAEVKADAGDALERFTVAEGYRVPGVALCAVAS
jgi:ubiquinone/menaquinone biosynthesis C-methylase UbiE